MSVLSRSAVKVFVFLVLATILTGWSGRSPVRMAERPDERQEGWKSDKQEAAGLGGGLAVSPHPSAYAESDADKLSRLLRGGDTTFSPLSVAIWRDYLAADYGTVQADAGSAYVKYLSGDGLGGFRVTFVIDGRESPSHLASYLFRADSFIGSALDNRLVPYSLWSWTDSFDGDPDDPAATDRTGGPSDYDYFDINGWQAGGAVVGNFRGFMTYGARTRPGNLPSGGGTYVGRLEAEVWRADKWQWGSRTTVRGTIHLEANFSERDIRGRIDALNIRARGANAFQGLQEGNSIDIPSAPFDEARIVAEWVGSDPGESATSRETDHGFAGVMIGEFYGPSAEELGGVLSGRLPATATTPEQFLIGSFGSSLIDPGN